MSRRPAKSLAVLAVLGAALLAFAIPAAAQQPPRRNTTPYPELFKTNFMKGCMVGTPAAACQCIIDEVERTLTLDEFADFDKAAEEKRMEGHPMTPWFRGVIQACYSRHPA
ncbi:MAG: hypothetical protein Q8L23_12825 [Caulobacter sp.]|nr:hypothetical protein [Caulobacter sp.]